jgi:vacuolar-type H+-ATPase subunit F/Vma7
MSTVSPLAYIGLPGTGFGWRLTGLTVYEEETAAESLALLKRLQAEQSHSIIFIDENLAVDGQGEMQASSQGMLPAVVLLPNIHKYRRIAARRLDQLIIKAIGSDIKF